LLSICINYSYLGYANSIIDTRFSADNYFLSITTLLKEGELLGVQYENFKKKKHGDQHCVDLLAEAMEVGARAPLLDHEISLNERRARIVEA
jgi:hypothetical protein